MTLGSYVTSQEKQASAPSAASEEFEDFVPALGTHDEDEYNGAPIGIRPENAFSESRSPWGSDQLGGWLSK